MQASSIKRGCGGIAVSLLAMLVTMLGGCVAAGRKPDVSARTLPLAPQSNARHQCGPSTLASVLAFHGKPVPEHVIAEAIYSPTAQGVLLSDMAWYARQQGFRADLRTGNLDDLQATVVQRLPPIVLLDYGIAHVRQPHFTAITGVLDGGIFQVNDERADDYVRMKRFERLWKRAGNQYLVITPVASP